MATRRCSSILLFPHCGAWKVPARAISQSTLLFGKTPFREKKSNALTVMQDKSIEKKTMYFEEVKKDLRNKQSFKAAIDGFIGRDVRRTGHVDFIYAALKKMKEFGVHKDLDVYKDLLNVFPKGRYVAQNVWQVEFMHYPRHQECCIDILQEMENNAVVPDIETYHIILNAFGDRSIAMRKFKRLMYWFPKFRHANPFAVPLPLPNDPAELAKIALERMCPDIEKEVTVVQARDLPEPHENTWIASLICPAQRSLISRIPDDRPVYVEGEFPIYVKEQFLKYFILRDEPSMLLEGKTNPEPWYNRDCDMNWDLPWEKENPKEYAPQPTLHEQDDGNILSMCITGTSTKDSLRDWIAHLSQSCPRLLQVPIIFRIRSVHLDTELTPFEEEPVQRSVQSSS